MRFDFISIFPSVFKDYMAESILGRAAKKRLISVYTHDLRTWAVDKHGHVDDKPFGGGPGMIMMLQPFVRAITSLRIRNRKQTRIILLAAKGKQFTHADAVRLASDYRRIVFLCGRYEGIDERVREHLVDEELSIGPYVLTGGELPAMVIADAISRHIPGVLGNAETLAEESHAVEGETEYPQYTRPASFKPSRNAKETWDIPAVLTSGDHKKIAEWRTLQSTRKEDKE